MKLKYRYLLPLIILLLSAAVTLAQEPATIIESLYVAFWPDYDDPSVLVLMTGVLPADAAFPAEVTIPLPADAEVNAVARITEEGMADTNYHVEGDALTFTTSDPQFRVEYYAPYDADGDQHTFDFTWNADLDVEEFQAEIQQPVNAGRMTTQPPPANVGQGPNDGLTYHALPAVSVPAGTPFEMSFSYDMDNPGLTAGGSVQTGPSTEPSTSDTTGRFSVNEWLLVVTGLALLLLVIAVTRLVTTRNGESGKARRSGKSRRPLKPSPKGRAAQARFCHQCGTQAEEGDQFCRKCGTELKT